MDTVPLPILPPPARKSRVGLIVACAVGAVMLLLCLCGLGGAIALTTLKSPDNEQRAPVVAPVEPAPPVSTAPPTPSSTATPSPAPMATVPNVAGKRLADAQAQLKAAGFTAVGTADVTGQGRIVVNPTNWIVRSQLPPAGSTIAVNAQVTLNVSKPSDGQPADPVTVGVVPKVVCRDLQAAQDLLQAAGFANLASRDGTGQGRAQVVDQNWLVTAQSAAAGSTPDPAQRITLTVVKYGERTGKSGCKS